MDKHDTYSENLRYEQAKKRVEELKGYYWHLGVFIVVQSFLFVNTFILELYEMHVGNWIFFGSFFGWGVAILIHTWQIFGLQLLFGKDWEERKIKEIMKREEEQGFANSGTE
ncbi:2TM domain-containing protein [Robertkochia aurantiaca]|uniref:2TM domain-containing protein n=1 Tax=Robertkochia aurantiaca TaxID=2873700 RepID=UPI001CC9773B|nr:2TM domain-containing protein [Robertkochia sp. 3YJGBD-33]